MCLSLTALGALERREHANFGGTKKSVQKSELVVFCEAQEYFAVTVEHFSVTCAQHIAVYLLASLASPPYLGVCVD